VVEAQKKKKPKKKTTKIIFVGNSHTYYHSMPKLVVEIGKLDSNRKIEVTTVALPNYSLEDHWNQGIAQAMLQKDKYDFMVAQQSSSALPESQVHLKNYALKYAGECKKYGITMNLYMVWPMKNRMFDFDNVIYSYTEAAKAAGASLSPVGKAWKRAWDKNPSIEFYDADELHSSKKGGVLAAMVIYAKLFKKNDLSFLDLQKTSWAKDLSLEEFEIFKAVVLELDK